jgi:hypothetical protein
MAIEWKYRGRIFNLADIESIRRLIAANPEASRWALSRKLCESWNWKQANGALRDMVCRGLLLMLERAGEIELPPVRRHPPGKQARPEPVIPDDRPVCGRLSELGPLTIEQVRRTPQEALFNGLIEQYHYLGYEQPVGEHLKYLVSAKGQAIACLAWSSSPRHLGCRDRFIGWGMEARRRKHSFAGLQYPVSDSAVGDGSASGIAHSGAHGQAGSGRLAAPLCTSGVSTGNLRRSGTVPRDVLSRGELGGGGTHDRPRQK